MRDARIKVWTRQGAHRRVGMRTIRVGKFWIVHNDVWVGRKEREECTNIIEDTLNDNRFSKLNDKDFLFLISQKMLLVKELWEEIENDVLGGVIEIRPHSIK